MKDPTERFTETVEAYLKYRPHYPHAIIPLLQTDCGLAKETMIADIGSGTGFLTELFLEHGNVVYGVEPNGAMREAGSLYLKQYPNFISVEGKAEATNLLNNSVGIVTAGTAFHWFDIEKTKREFQRILRVPGFVVLIWNVRDLDDLLVRDYEALIRKYGTDYKESNASKFNQTAVAEFFAPFKMQEAQFLNTQHLDWSGFRGRLLSASYSLRPNDERYEEMIDALREIFDRYQKDGMVQFVYQTKLYYGRFL